MGLLITDIPQHLVRIRNHRRALIRPDRRNLLHPVGDPIGIVNDNLMGLFRTQIFKLLQHLLRRAQIQRRLLIRICKSLARHNDPAVHLVLRIQEMYVAGCNHRLMELLPQFNDLPVNFFQIFLILHLRNTVAGNHKTVISQGLYLQIIVVIHDPCNPFLGLII